MTDKAKDEKEKKPGSRALLKGALVVLGASTILQVSGGVPSANALDTNKTTQTTSNKTAAKTDKWQKADVKSSGKVVNQNKTSNKTVKTQNTIK